MAVFFLCLVMLTGSVFAATDRDRCLTDALATAGNSVTVGELRASCAADAEDQGPGSTASPVADALVNSDNQSLLQQRLTTDYENTSREYVIMTHRPNYITYSYNSHVNQAPFEEESGLDEPLDDEEVKFQVSFKMPLSRDLFGTSTDAFFAYTATSWWQTFNDDVSNPFRETNYEPELFIRHYGGPEFLGMRIAGWDLGFNHQSNGRSGDLSRSWNRLYGTLGFDRGDLALTVKAWYRIPEDDEDDDNPHMRRYYGAGEARAIWAPNKNTFTAMLRPGTEENAVELTWSYQISDYIRLYSQYFNGYGESLIDYNVRTERIGIGFALNDFLQNN
jgi:phospholipase A1